MSYFYVFKSNFIKYTKYTFNARSQTQATGLYCNLCKTRGKGFGYHSFPKCKTLFAQWIAFVQRANPMWKYVKSARLCSKHFRKHLIEKRGRKSVLSADAVSTVYNNLLHARTEIDKPGETHLKDITNNQNSTTEATGAINTGQFHPEPQVLLHIHRDHTYAMPLNEIKSKIVIINTVAENASSKCQNSTTAG